MRASLLFVFTLGCAGVLPAQTTTPNNYADPQSWLCRPGAHDACETDLSTTIVRADGSTARESWTGDNRAAIDCFYVYPTVSTDQTPNSDMLADPAEVNVIHHQFARFGSKCRTFAPLYRQITLRGLLSSMGGGGGFKLDAGLGYDDVRDAWKYYLEHDNQGRGFILIGHSQGSFVLAQLIRQEIDGKPIQSRMISAMLMGVTIAVPKGKDVGGSFQHVPLCHSASQTGCVITFATYRSNVPPPAQTLFGKVPDPSMVAACTNPAALEGGSGELHAYLSADGRTITTPIPVKPWTSKAPIYTPWVSVPGLLTSRCATNDAATYLELTVHGDPADARVDDITGDISANGQVRTEWGMHLIDANLAMGNLLDIAEKQSKAWLAAQTH